MPGWRTVTLDVDAGHHRLPARDCPRPRGHGQGVGRRPGRTAIADELGCGALVSLGGDVAVATAPTGGFSVGIADMCGDPTPRPRCPSPRGAWPRRASGRRHWMLGDTTVHHLVDPATGLPATPLAYRLGGRRLLRRRQHRLHRRDGHGGGGRRPGSRAAPARPPGGASTGRGHRGRLARDLTRPAGPMTAATATVARGASNGKALWYLTRSTGWWR